jgi:Cu2+-exporting ATPase
MTCCIPSSAMASCLADAGAAANEELRLASRRLPDGLWQTDIAVPGIHCGGCIRRIETELAKLDLVRRVRVNLSSRRASVLWQDAAIPPPLLQALSTIGYEAHLHDDTGDATDPERRRLLRALAVAAFASSNIMLFSVGVWAGADAWTRDLFHALSGVAALPTLLYSGRIFFLSAWSALRRGRTNMDVPISIGVILAFALSFYETLTSGPHAYFDAAISLVFFLLIGRTLDHVMRDKARSAVLGLARIGARGALTSGPDGVMLYRPVAEIAPGMGVHLAAGERVPVDGFVLSGRSQLDCALVTGETIPVPAEPGTRLSAGTLNLTGPLDMQATAAAKDSFLAEMTRMMEAAEAGRGGYRRLADRASALYAPVVHTAAALSFLGWMLADGDMHHALTVAIAVLIVTCPCALGLAVPMVQVVAARRLFEAGVMVRDGGALERLAEVDRAIFDKTGTLTAGIVRIEEEVAGDGSALALAAAIAVHSSHPYSRAIAARAVGDGPVLQAGQVREEPGNGLEAEVDGHVYRLGRASWALPPTACGQQGTVFARDGEAIARFRFAQPLRPGAVAAIAGLREMGIAAEIVSGDAPEPVAEVAEALALPASAGVAPEGKTRRIAALRASGHKVVMIGDGLNDAPALSAAHASIAPASAAEVGRNAADIVFLHDDLTAVPLALRTARWAAVLIRQNFALAIGYNLVAVPIAVLGHLTPLLAAIAMSSSSLIVVVNALRLGAPSSTAAKPRPAPDGSATIAGIAR